MSGRERARKKRRRRRRRSFGHLVVLFLSLDLYLARTTIQQLKVVDSAPETAEAQRARQGANKQQAERLDASMAFHSCSSCSAALVVQAELRHSAGWPLTSALNLCENFCPFLENVAKLARSHAMFASGLAAASTEERKRRSLASSFWTKLGKRAREWKQKLGHLSRELAKLERRPALQLWRRRRSFGDNKMARAR